MEITDPTLARCNECDLVLLRPQSPTLGICYPLCDLRCPLCVGPLAEAPLLLATYLPQTKGSSLRSGRSASAPLPDPNEEEFRDGLPAKELRDAWAYWSTVERGSNAIADLQFMGDEYRLAWWSVQMPNRTIDSFGGWDHESFRPNGKTWSEVEAIAAYPCKNCNGISPETCAIPGNHP